jgi:hypothetical protein
LVLRYFRRVQIRRSICFAIRFCDAANDGESLNKFNDASVRRLGARQENRYVQSLFERAASGSLCQTALISTLDRLRIGQP